jgi:hypothetical protein
MLHTMTVGASGPGELPVWPGTPSDPPAAAPEPAPASLAFDVLPDELVEGQSASFAWHCGPDVVSTEVVGWAEGPMLGGEREEGESVVLSECCHRTDGAITWTPPSLDSINVLVKVKAYGSDGRLKDWVARTIPYRPAAFAERRHDGIYVWLSRDDGQRLYLQEGGRLVFYTLCSGSSTGEVLPADEHPDRPHDHYGVFSVKSKSVDHYSSLNEAWRMRYCLHYLNGHAIHATSPNFYDQLGDPASHGCIRLHLVEAMALFRRVEVGTRVEIF